MRHLCHRRRRWRTKRRHLHWHRIALPPLFPPALFCLTSPLFLLPPRRQRHRCLTCLLWHHIALPHLSLLPPPSSSSTTQMPHLPPLPPMASHSSASPASSLLIVNDEDAHLPPLSPLASNRSASSSSSLLIIDNVDALLTSSSSSSATQLCLTCPLIILPSSSVM